MTTLLPTRTSFKTFSHINRISRRSSNKNIVTSISHSDPNTTHHIVNSQYMYSTSTSSSTPIMSTSTPKAPIYLRPIPLPATFSNSSTTPSSTTPTTADLASHILTSLKTNTQIPRLSQTHPTTPLTQSQGYQTSLSILHSRIKTHKETPIGRKLGFTNRHIWAEYNVDSPNWNYIYDSTVLDISASPSTETTTTAVDLTRLRNLEPRIEPELVLGLSSSSANISETDVLECIEWIAAGFEIVISPWKGWVFNAAETTAAFALHGRLCIGQRVFVRDMVDRCGSDAVLEMLKTFRVELVRDGGVLDTGVGGNVLGGEGPVGALAWLGRKMQTEEGSGHLPLGEGEVVTTGTLTRALVMFDLEAKDEVWEMRVTGLDGVHGVKCRFVC